MRRPTVLVPLDRTMQLPLTLASGLRATFADVVSSPLPGRLAALVRRFNRPIVTNAQGRSANGAIATETSSRINRRGRR
jgi:hypothetical protein